MSAEERVAKKAKITDFWSNVKTRKNNVPGDWKIVADSLIYRHFGLPIESGKRYRVCAFDLDHTIITTNSGRVMAKDARDWKFLLPGVPKKICEEVGRVAGAETETIAETEAEAEAEAEAETEAETIAAAKTEAKEDILSILVIFSNQNAKQGILLRDVAERTMFQNKIENVVAKLGVESLCPVIACFAASRDIYRKPATGMWDFVVKELIGKAQNSTIVADRSFFVGDAAGRLAGWKPGKSADWSGVDRKFAMNVGIQFYTPEEYFLGEETCQLFDLGRSPASLLLSAESQELSLPRADAQEMVIAVGSPASGKTFFYRRYFCSSHVHVNRDNLGTMAKCKAAVRAAIAAGKSVFVDNTHPTIGSRLEFISIAAEFGIPVRCCLFVTDEWLNKHLDVFRSITGKVEPLPPVAFHSFYSKYQPPSEKEGFAQIIQIPFIPNFESEEHTDIFKQYLF